MYLIRHVVILVLFNSNIFCISLITYMSNDCINSLLFQSGSQTIIDSSTLIHYIGSDHLVFVVINPLCRCMQLLPVFA